MNTSRDLDVFQPNHVLVKYDGSHSDLRLSIVRGRSVAIITIKF